MLSTTQFLTFAYPGSLNTRTGGYIYDKRLLAELRQLGWRVDEIELPDRFPFPSSTDLDQAIDALDGVDLDCPLIIDGLAFGTFGERAKRLADRRLLIGLVHHPLALETGLNAAQATLLEKSERAALAVCDRVIVTSPTTAETLINDYGVLAKRLITALPGQASTPLANPAIGGPLHLLAIGTVTPRKDFGQLLRALDPLADQDWRLTIAGSLDRDPDCANALLDQLRAYPWREKVRLTGEIDQSALDLFYRDTHVFVSSSRFEGYGMALMDAIGYGVPVVAVRGGAVGDVLPGGAALLVEPGDLEGFSDALASIIDNPKLRERLRGAAKDARTQLPTWGETANTVARGIEGADRS